MKFREPLNFVLENKEDIHIYKETEVYKVSLYLSELKLLFHNDPRKLKAFSMLRTKFP